MTITIYSHRHVPEELNYRFSNLLESNDTVLIENSTRDYYNETVKYFRSLSSKGNPSPGVVSEFPDFVDKLRDALRNKEKHIIVENSPLTNKDYYRFKGLQDSCLRDFIEGRFDDSCETHLKIIRHLIDFDGRRESSLIDLLEDAQQKHENILVPFGVRHLIYRKLKERGLDARRVFPFNPYELGSSLESIRRIQFNKPYTLQSMARPIVETFLEEYMINYHGDSFDEASNKSRSILERTSDEDLKSISEYLGENLTRQRFPMEFTALFFKKRGLEI